MAATRYGLHLSHQTLIHTNLELNPDGYCLLSNSLWINVLQTI